MSRVGGRSTITGGIRGADLSVEAKFCKLVPIWLRIDPDVVVMPVESPESHQFFVVHLLLEHWTEQHNRVKLNLEATKTRLQEAEEGMDRSCEFYQKQFRLLGIENDL